MNQNANFSNFYSNVTSSSYIPEQFQVVDYILLLLYSMVVVIGVGGNSLVISWFSSYKNKGKPGSALVIVLAMNDLIASIITPLYGIHLMVSFKTKPYLAWHLGKKLCGTFQASTTLVWLATPWLLVAIATERFRYASMYHSNHLSSSKVCEALYC